MSINDSPQIPILTSLISDVNDLKHDCENLYGRILDIDNGEGSRIVNEDERKANEVIRKTNEVIRQQKIDEFSTSLETITKLIADYKHLSSGDDWTNAIKQAMTDLTNGGVIKFHSGIFKHNGIITVPKNVSIVGEGYNTILEAVNDIEQCIKLTGNNSLEKIYLKSNATTRGQADINSKVYVVGDNVLVNNCVIDGAKSVGFMVTNSKNVNILNNVVKNTMADGIHITNKSSDVLVQGNVVDNVGDDGIAFVSYLSNGDRVCECKAINNTILNVKARGISNIGSKDIIIANNTVNGTGAAGIIVAQEDSYSTYGSINTLIECNIIKSYSKTVNHGGILVSNNICDNADIDKRGYKTSIKGNIIDGENAVSKFGITIDNSDNVIIIGNQVYNIGSSFGGIRCGNFAVSSNTRRIQNIIVSENYVDGGNQCIFSRIDYLQFSKNNFMNITLTSGRCILLYFCSYSTIDMNIVTDTTNTISIIKIEDLYKSIVGYNNASIVYGIVSSGGINPYDGTYEWYNKILESYGVTVPTLTPTANHRVGAIGTVAYDATNSKLMVRTSQNTWKGVGIV